ncbi:DUF488 domain-containing protein [Paenibacillus massiliensis]|uniref:DUF488 domain-containing protein n=1 Tax=Paenibacillus massiliensis TaxID=225917 RepID=UPI0003698D64|nr:DUF488 domain-containing protein [Paenibacillus massiliensis]
MQTHPFLLKRIYEPSYSSDGIRILVDRLWPRGIAKESAQLDFWMKEVAPSPELRRWFGHDPARFEEFRELYTLELTTDGIQPHVARILEFASKKPVTLIYAAKDVQHNHAIVLRELLESLKLK